MCREWTSSLTATVLSSRGLCNLGFPTQKASIPGTFRNGIGFCSCCCTALRQSERCSMPVAAWESFSLHKTAARAICSAHTPLLWYELSEYDQGECNSDLENQARQLSRCLKAHGSTQLTAACCFQAVCEGQECHEEPSQRELQPPQMERGVQIPGA